MFTAMMLVLKLLFGCLRLVVDTEDDIRRNTTFTVASMLSGTGILKPELAKVIVKKIGTDGADNNTRAEVLSLLGGGSAHDFGYANT